MSAVGMAEDPSDFNRSGAFSRPSGTELPASRNPSNKLLGYCRLVPPGQREQASCTRHSLFNDRAQQQWSYLEERLRRENSHLQSPGLLLNCIVFSN